MMGEYLTISDLESIGFKKVSEAGGWVDWERNGFIISSELGINAGGFHTRKGEVIVYIDTIEDLRQQL